LSLLDDTDLFQDSDGTKTKKLSDTEGSEPQHNGRTTPPNRSRKVMITKGRNNRQDHAKEGNDPAQKVETCIDETDPQDPVHLGMTRSSHRNPDLFSCLTRKSEIHSTSPRDFNISQVYRTEIFFPPTFTLEGM